MIRMTELLIFAAAGALAGVCMSFLPLSIKIPVELGMFPTIFKTGFKFASELK